MSGGRGPRGGDQPVELAGVFHVQTRKGSGGDAHCVRRSCQVYGYTPHTLARPCARQGRSVGGESSSEDCEDGGGMGVYSEGGPTGDCVRVQVPRLDTDQLGR